MYQVIVMSEQSFEFSFSVSQSAKNRRSKPARSVLAWPFDAFSVSPDEMLVHVRDGQRTHRLRLDEVSILQRCEPMQTAEQHADAILRAEDSANSRRPLVEIIDRLFDRGLLATESSVTAQFTKSNRPSQPTPISTLMIRSSGRPRAMKRALESILHHGASGIEISTCVVIDDSRDQVMGDRSEIAGLLGRRANEAKLPGYLVGDYRRMIEAQTDSESMEDVVPAGAVTGIRNTAAAYAAGIDDWIGAWNIAREIGHSEIVDEILPS